MFATSFWLSFGIPVLESYWLQCWLRSITLPSHEPWIHKGHKGPNIDPRGVSSNGTPIFHSNSFSGKILMNSTIWFVTKPILKQGFYLGVQFQFFRGFIPTYGEMVLPIKNHPKCNTKYKSQTPFDKIVHYIHPIKSPLSLLKIAILKDVKTC